jgi:hypothetical protein
VAEGTIKNHVSNILSKMGVRDRTRAVLKAIEQGYLELPGFPNTCETRIFRNLTIYVEFNY